MTELPIFFMPSQFLLRAASTPAATTPGPHNILPHHPCMAPSAPPTRCARVPLTCSLSLPCILPSPPCHSTPRTLHLHLQAAAPCCEHTPPAIATVSQPMPLHAAH